MKSWKLGEIAQLLGSPIKSEKEVQNICTDTRQIKKGDIFIALVGEKYDGHDFIEMAFEKGASACICSKPLHNNYGEYIIYVKDTGIALLALATAYRKKFDIKVVAVTGSVGKTTTKDMIAQAISAECNVLKTEGNLNNEIGLPKTVFSVDDFTEVAVLEMGMSDLGEISVLSKCAKPDIAVITNVGVSHIENLKTRENILKAKLEITDGMPPGSPLVINIDNDLLAGVDQYMGHKIIRYAIYNKKADVFASDLKENYDKLETEFYINDDGEKIYCKIPCIGRHNVLNALAVYCITKEFGLDIKKCIISLSGYKPTGMRQNIVKKPGITIIEDCYNASPDSMAAAIETLSKINPEKGGRRIAVLGDMLELGEMSKEAHRRVGKMLATHKIDMIFACGSDAYYIIEGAETYGSVNTFFSNSKEEVSKRLNSCVKYGDVILFKASRGIGLEDIIHTVYENLQV